MAMTIKCKCETCEREFRGSIELHFETNHFCCPHCGSTIVAVKKGNSWVNQFYTGNSIAALIPHEG